MSTILPQLERDLLAAAQRSLAAREATAGREQAVASRGDADFARERRAGIRRLTARVQRIRRLPLLMLGLGGALGTTTIALAASGVILTGAPVRPEGPLTPRAGIGVPKPGGSLLLPLRAADPAGGPPWGMRIVHTTRGEVCLQIGRVHDGRLGELGIDGAFHDDGMFHPLPAVALPATSRMGIALPLDAGDVNCALAGRAVSAYLEGSDRNAAAPENANTRAPRGDLRDIYFGLLGPHAVSVSYREGAEVKSEAVQPGVGAYLVVERARAHQPVAQSGEAEGTIDDLSPAQSQLKAYTYRLDGRVCERAGRKGPHAQWVVAHPCSQPRFPAAAPSTRRLHEPIGVRLIERAHVVSSASVSFKAPFAVSGAAAEYVVEIPAYDRAGHITGFKDTAIQHDVRSGQKLSAKITRPFDKRCLGHPVVVRVVYQRSPDVDQTIVGERGIEPPAGARTPAPVCPRPRPFVHAAAGR